MGQKDSFEVRFWRNAWNTLKIAFIALSVVCSVFWALDYFFGLPFPDDFKVIVGFSGILIGNLTHKYHPELLEWGNEGKLRDWE